MPVPIDLELSDQVLRLRAWRADDAPQLHEAVRESLATVGRWLPWYHAGYDLPQARAWIEHCREGWLAQEHFAFAVIEQATGRLLGSVGLNQRNRTHRSAAMGYWVRQSRQGQGIARRAVRLAAQFGFGALELVRIEIVALPDNHASRARGGGLRRPFRGDRASPSVGGRRGQRRGGVCTAAAGYRAAVAAAPASGAYLRFFISRIIRWRLRCCASVNTLRRPANGLSPSRKSIRIGVPSIL